MLLLCFLLCILIPPLVTLRPGVLLALSKQAPNTTAAVKKPPQPDGFEPVFRHYLTETLPKARILLLPEVSGRYEDRVNYQLTELYLNNIDYDRPPRLTIRRQGIIVQLNRITAKILGKWAYQQDSWRSISENGYVRINVTRGSLRLMKRSNRPPVAQEIACSGRFRGISIKFVDQDNVYLLQRIGTAVERNVSRLVTNSMCAELRNRMAEAIQENDERVFLRSQRANPERSQLKLKTKFTFMDNSSLSYSLTTLPQPQAHYVVVKMRGLYKSANAMTPPFTDMPPPLPTFDPQSNHKPGSTAIYHISEYTINSMFHAKFYDGRLSKYVNGSEICPASECVRKIFTHDFWKENALGNGSIDMLIRAKRPPIMTIHMNKAVLSLSLSLAVYSVKPSGSEYLFNLTSNLQFSYWYRLSGVSRSLHCEAVMKATTGLYQTDHSYRIARQSLAPSAQEGYQDLVSLVNNHVIESTLNDMCADGLPLPYVVGEVLGDGGDDSDISLRTNGFITVTATRVKAARPLATS